MPLSLVLIISHFVCQIKNGIPSLVPMDGKILEDEGAPKPEDNADSSSISGENRGRNS